MNTEDTIAAIATAQGEGGIGIIRISGSEAKNILTAVFSPANKKVGIYENKKLIYGNIVDPDTDSTIDEVLVVYMQAPATYTTEDVVEIQCHGSIVALRRILDLVLRKGARLAEPGEFTKRAFLNGRLDLSQAEAVIDLIKAKTDIGYDVALSQLSGNLSEKIHAFRASLIDVLVLLAVNIDYPDEDIEEVSYQQLTDNLAKIRTDMKALLDTCKTGKILKEGLDTAIIGKPNVGKSSLLNALLREARAIVTEIPGTTRDTIEEMLNIEGVYLKITDTAGIRLTDDIVEKIGVEKSKVSFNKAELIIFIVDGSKPLEKEDKEIIAAIGDKKAIVLINKTDLGASVKRQDIEALLPGKKIIETVIKTGQGIKELENEIIQMVFAGKVIGRGEALISNTRHEALLQRAETSLGEALTAALGAEPLELIEIDVKSAWELLGEITGETVSEDIINEVFARFCLGK